MSCFFFFYRIYINLLYSYYDSHNPKDFSELSYENRYVSLVLSRLFYANSQGRRKVFNDILVNKKGLP
jgi:hypothetical protein